MDDLARKKRARRSAPKSRKRVELHLGIAPFFLGELSSGMIEFKEKAPRREECQSPTEKGSDELGHLAEKLSDAVETTAESRNKKTPVGKTALGGKLT